MKTATGHPVSESPKIQAMNQEFWEKNAVAWAQVVRSRLIDTRKVTDPAILAEIFRLAAREVLDVGCGEGWAARALLAREIGYTGLDFSQELVGLARKAHPKVAFVNLAYQELENWLPERKPDLALFNFSLFEEDVRPVLRQTARLIQPHGGILIQTLHPFTTLNPYQDGWRTEDFKSFPGFFAGTMDWYGRTLASWLRAISESGLQIESLVEPLNPLTNQPASLIFSLRV